MTEGQVCKDSLLQVYDNVLTIQEYFAIRLHRAIDPDEEDFQKFVQQTVIAFSEELTENDAMERKVLQMPAPSIPVILERLVGECTSECIPKDLQRKYLFCNEKYFTRLVSCITESGEGQEERKRPSGAQAILCLLSRGSLFSWLPGPNFIQRTGKW